MSTRGRQLFDSYVAHYLNQPQLSLSIQSHAFTLMGQARGAAISMNEITDEVGPLPAALAAAIIKK